MILMRHMHKNGASLGGDDRVIVIAKRHDQVIPVVITPEALMRKMIGKLYQAIIVRALWIIAPTVSFLNDMKRQAGLRRA